MANEKLCKLYVSVGDKQKTESKLFKELLKSFGDFQIALIAYTASKKEAFKQLAEQKGLELNEQGEYSANDVISLLNGQSFLETKNDLLKIKQTIKVGEKSIVDENGKTRVFDDIQGCIQAVTNFNENNPLYLASISKINTEDNIQRYKIDVEPRTSLRMDSVYYEQYTKKMLSTLQEALQVSFSEEDAKQIIKNLGSILDFSKIVDEINFLKTEIIGEVRNGQLNEGYTINRLNSLFNEYYTQYQNEKNDEPNTLDEVRKRIALVFALLHTKEEKNSNEGIYKYIKDNPSLFSSVKLDGSFEDFITTLFKSLDKIAQMTDDRPKALGESLFRSFNSVNFSNKFKSFRENYHKSLSGRNSNDTQLSEAMHMQNYINAQKKEFINILTDIKKTNAHVKETVLQVDKLLSPLHNLLFELQVAISNDIYLKDKQLDFSKQRGIKDSKMEEETETLRTLKRNLNLLLKNPNDLNMYDITYKNAILNVYNYLARILDIAENKVAEIHAGLTTKHENTPELFRFLNNSANDIYSLKNTFSFYYHILQDLSAGKDSTLLNNSNLKTRYIDGIQQGSEEIVNKMFYGEESIFKRLETVQKSLIRSTIEQFVRHSYKNQGWSEQQILTEVNNIIDHMGDDVRSFFMTTSMAKNNNGFIAYMGKIIRDYQKLRDDAVLKFKVQNDGLAMEYAKRLGLPEDAIPNTEFMYLGDRVVTDFNQDLYDRVKKEKFSELQRKYKSIEKVNQLMKEWEKNMTEDFPIYERNTDGDIVIDEQGEKVVFDVKRVPKASEFPQLRLKAGVTMEQVANKLNTSEDKIDDYILFRNKDKLTGLIEVYKPKSDLTVDQKWYYDEALYLKATLTEFLPEGANDLFLAPQVLMDSTALLQAGRIGDSFKEYWNEFFETGMQVNEMNMNQFTADGENTLVGVHTDGSGKKMYAIPVPAAKRLPKEYQGQLLKDFTTGLIRLATTAFNYKFMSDIEGMINIMADSAIQANKSNDVHNVQTQRLSERNDTLGVMHLMSRVAPHAGAFTNEAFIHGMLASTLYGYTLDEKWLHDNKAKIARTTKVLLKYSSMTALSVNLKGMIANVTAGEYQMILEAIAGSVAKALGSSKTAEFFSLGSFMRASALIATKGVGGIDKIARNRAKTLHGLFAELLDASQSTFTDMSQFTYRDTAGHIIAMDYGYGGYGAGEHLLKHTVMLAILCERQVKNKNGEVISLYDAFEEYKTKRGIEQIRLKEGITTLEGGAIDEAYMTELKNDILDCNQMMHGAMNKEDQSYLKQFLLFRTMAQLRGFIFEYIRRRFAGKHYTVSGRQNEGFYLSVWYFLKDVKDYMNMAAITELTEQGEEVIKERPSIKEAWDNVRAHSTKRRKQNLVRATSELTFYACCAFMFGGGYLVLDDDDDDWLTMMFKYQTRRLGMEIMSFSALGIPSQSQQMLNNLIPCWNTIANTFYAIEGLYNGDINEEILKGPHKGENRYLYYLKRKSIPFWGQINQMVNMTTDRDIMKSLEYQMSR